MTMHLEDITKFQKEFDARHGWTDEFKEFDDKFFDRLQYAAIALPGEVGEFANMLKKIIREKKLTGKVNSEYLASMKEELTDVFIYLIILSIILKVDIGEAYYGKMKRNEEKYRNFEV